jgi:alpha-glucosidase
MIASGAHAESLRAYQLTHEGVVVEISALRPDVLRVRAGREALPEDASWAVLAGARQSHTLMDMEQKGEEVVLKTSSLTARLNRRTLALRVEDASGKLVLDDARGEALHLSAKGFELKKTMPAQTHYFGLGDKTGPLDRRGRAFTLWNTDAYQFGPDSDPLYKSIPFVLGAEASGRSFGLFVDTPWRSQFDFGKVQGGTLSISSEGPGLDYYVLAGPDAHAVLSQYAFLTGPTPLPPQWALGFQQSRYSYMNEAEARAIVDRARADHIPLDALYLDIDYQDRNRPFTVNTKSFPDLPKLVGDFKALGVRTILITDLHIAAAPGQNYAPYDSGKAADLFVKRPDGADYVGEVWPGPAVFPDFSRPAARDWWGGLYTGYVKMGVAGFWNDMNEPAIFKVASKTMPEDVVHRIEEPGFTPRAASHAEMHNVYGMLNGRATYEGLLKLDPNTRPFVLTRASYAGGQRYAATWTGDNTSSWAHLKLSVSQLANLGLSGFSMAGDDIGGYAGKAPSPELLTRWIQVGAFNPVFRDHEEKGKPPQEVWVHGPEQEAIRKRYIEARYRLMPYLYQLAKEASQTGLPIMRPVFLEFASSLAEPQASEQFMLGPDLLVAPVTEPDPKPYRITLPGTGWYDYWTGRQLALGVSAEQPSLERMPVFVRPGAILPHQPLVQSTAQTPEGPLELDVYPGKDCRGTLYFDDGISLNYQRGESLSQTVSCSVDKGVVRVTLSPRQGTWAPWWSQLKVTVHGWTAPQAVAVAGGTSLAAQIDPARQTVTVEAPYGGGAQVIELRP